MPFTVLCLTVIVYLLFVRVCFMCMYVCMCVLRGWSSVLIVT